MVRPYICAASLFILAICMTPVREVSGHAFPDHSEPRVGVSVASASGVRIWFDGALEPAFSTLQVLNASGKKIDKGDSRVNPSDASLLEVSIPSIPPGVYRVLWSVVSRDGHKTEGDYTFTVK